MVRVLWFTFSLVAVVCAAPCLAISFVEDISTVHHNESTILYNPNILLVHHGADLPHDFFTASDNYQNEGLTTGTLNLLDVVDRYHTNLVPNLVREKDFRGAIAHLTYTLRRFPNHPKALIFAGMIAILEKQHSLAINFYENALKLYPQHAATHLQYGAFLVSIGQNKLAIARLEQAKEMDSKLVGTYVYLSAAYRRIGDLTLAQENEQRAKALGFAGKIPGQE
jgi:tetratricopeptide (TPR) repeat protein